MQVSEIRNSEWGFSTKGVGQVVQGLDDIRQCIRIILHTKKGTDPLRPLFGCDINKFIDKPINSVVPSAIREIIEAVTLWEPRVEIISITHQLIDYELTFFIKFKVLNTVDIGQVDIAYGIK